MSDFNISGIGEQIIIKGAAKTVVDFLSSESFDIGDKYVLDYLYKSFFDEQKIEFGFLGVCVHNG